MRLTLILVLFFCVSCKRPTQTTLEKVKGLNLNVIDGTIITYYPSGYRDRAEANLSLLNKSIRFFKENFDINEKFSIAIIDSTEWGKITHIPYGLPFVSGPPYIICVPANSNNILFKTIRTAIDGYKLNTKYGMTNDEIVHIFVSLIGLHELGHIYAKTYGIRFPNKWTYEFAATYFAYSYIDQNFIKDREIWIDVSKILTKKIQPRYTSLADFEKKYSEVGIKNYAWYQVIFLLRVKELYENQGNDFLTNLRNYHWHSSSTTEYLNEMDDITPGFTKWALRYRLLK